MTDDLLTPETAAALRAPFAAELIGKLPRIWCGACRDARSKVCSEHRKTKCDECQNKITDAHLHLDYVGHADVTDRLLQVDPQWTWEPLAFTAEGLPAFGNGGLWIRMTVAGVTRLGFGDAPGKSGGDAVKEVIGDAIRNAALRFGVGLDLWRKEKPPVDDGATARPARRQSRQRSEPEQQDGPRMISEPMSRRLHQLFNQSGITDRDARLNYTSEIVKREVPSSNDLTFSEARLLIKTLEDALAEPRDENPDDGGTA